MQNGKSPRFSLCRMVNLQDFPLVAFIPLPSKINPNPALPAAFIPFFRRIFLMAYAMKIHLKKNAAANGLELRERLQGLTATDVTHSRESKAAILIFYI